MKSVEDETWNIFYVNIHEKSLKYRGWHNIENLLLSSQS